MIALTLLCKFSGRVAAPSWELLHDSISREPKDPLSRGKEDRIRRQRRSRACDVLCDIEDQKGLWPLSRACPCGCVWGTHSISWALSLHRFYERHVSCSIDLILRIQRYSI